MMSLHGRVRKDTMETEPATTPTTWRVAIPASVTLTGLFLGVVSILLAPTNLYAAASAIAVATVCDAVDGAVARLTRSQSEFGQQLDSLADIVSFGIAPAVLVYYWALIPDGGGIDLRVAAPLMFVAAGAVRLARYNARAGTRAKGPELHFEGLPIPAGALLPTTTVMLWHELDVPSLQTPSVAIGLLLVAGALMVCTVPFPAYKSARSIAVKVTFYGIMVMGLSMLALGLPGGSTLFVLTAGYCLYGLGKGLLVGRGSTS